MKNLSAEMQQTKKELQKAYLDAKQSRKRAKELYRAQIKALKAQIKFSKEMLKRARSAEKQAREDYKNFFQEVEVVEDVVSLERELEEVIQQEMSHEPEVVVVEPPKRRGPKPGSRKAPAKRGPKTAATAEAKAPAKRGPKTAATAEAKAPAKRGRKKTEPVSGNELSQIKGIGEKVAAMLNANGIVTFADLASTSADTLRGLLRANEMSKFRNPINWPALAAAMAGLPAPEVEAVAKPAAKRGPKPKAKKVVAKTKAANGRRKKSAASQGDDLTQIDGIGAKVAEALNGAGIYTYQQMAETSLDQFKKILFNNKMSKFRNPSNWAEDAEKLLEQQAS